jgi:putative endopeptidase
MRGYCALPSSFLLGAVVLAACRTGVEPPGGAGGSAQPVVAQDVAQEVLSNLDTAVSPCDDFYRYACGGWLDRTEIPPDESRFGRFNVLRERNQATLHRILDSAAADQGATGERGKLGQFYRTCMDEEAIERRGLEPLQPTLREIDGVDGVEALMGMAGRLHRQGIPVLFGFHVAPDYEDPGINLAHFAQGGLGLPDREYYLGSDERSVALREGYRAHVGRMFELLEVGDAKVQADAVLDVEKRLAEAWMPRDELRDPKKRYHPVDRAALQAITPGLPWNAYFAGTGHAEMAALNLSPRVYLERMEAVLRESKPEALRAYLRWHLVRAAADHLPERFVQANFEFYGKTLRGQQDLEPRWKRCVQATDGALGEILGQDYVASEFAGDSKQVALDMIQQIEAAFAEGLADLAWMDDATRGRALEKMHAVVNKIGYPDEWRDYGALDVGDDHLGNMVAASVFEFDREAREVGQAVDRGRWYMTPPTVNAYYNPSGNEMVFPAGILQPPFFDPEYPMAINFGGIGMVMGHELTHGFDDQGRKFDGTGRLTQWWEDSVVERFEEQTACVEKLYDGYEVQPGLTLNGKLTLGENIADFGGIKQAYRAFRQWASDSGVALDAPAMDGLTHAQLFFVAYGQIWCSKATPEIERVLALTDPHAHSRYRVNGPLSNLPEFWETFSCEEEQPMRPTNTCEVW